MSHGKKRNPLILVVDDAHINRKMLHTMLNKAGYHTLDAESGMQARDLARQHLPDLILLDVMMPEEDGFDTCRKLKQDPKTQDIPIIFISALNDTDNIVQGLELGGVDYVSKPFAQPEVLARIRVHLELKFARERLIEAQVQRFEELRQAQESFLVDPVKMPEAQFSYVYQPVLEAGGDFLDVIQAGEDKHVYVVADISGHDLGTAYITSALKALFEQNLNPYTPMPEGLKMINAVLNRILKPTQHLTANFLNIDRSHNSLLLYNSGHPAPILVEKATGQVQTLQAWGDVLGPFEQIELGSLEKKVQSGDRIYLYTDGLVEHFGANFVSRQEGIEKLSRACAQASQYSLQESLKYVVEQICPDKSLLQDDAVLLVTEI